jgi:predicted DNA-binding transcriptional regulator YafY
LTTLCRTCHEKEHRYGFTTDNFNKDRKPLGKSEIVSKAIREKKNLKIKYSSPDFKSKLQETTIRIITPIELYKAEYRTRSGVDGYRVTVRAFCHLRKSERNFQIRRIKEIELLM